MGIHRTTKGTKSTRHKENVDQEKTTRVVKEICHHLNSYLMGSQLGLFFCLRCGRRCALGFFFLGPSLCPAQLVRLVRRCFCRVRFLLRQPRCL